MYFTQELAFSNTNALAFVALITSVAYLTPGIVTLVTDGLSGGRYWVLIGFGCVYLFGLVIVAATAFVDYSMHLRRVCTFFGSFLVAFGAGAFESCLPAFGVGQLHTNKELAMSNCIKGRTEVTIETKDFETNPPMLTTDNDEASGNQAFFSEFCLWRNVGGVLAFAVVPCVGGHFGSGAAFGLTTCAMGIAMVVFSSVCHQYVHSTNNDVPLVTTLHCLWILFVDYIQSSCISLWCPCLDCVMDDPLLRPVEIVKHLENTEDTLHAMTVMAFFIIPWMVFDQMYSLWVIQASQMNLHGLQPGFMNILNFVQVVIFLPLLERVLYPIMALWGWDISPPNRMSQGMVMFAIAFFISGVLQGIGANRQEVELTSISVFWQVPQYTILAVGELFLMVTGVQYACAQSHPSMKTFISVVIWTTRGIGSLVSGIFYRTMFRYLTLESISFIFSGLMLLNFGLFLCAMAESDRALMEDVEANHHSKDSEDNRLTVAIPI